MSENVNLLSEYNPRDEDQRPYCSSVVRRVHHYDYIQVVLFVHLAWKGECFCHAQMKNCALSAYKETHFSSFHTLKTTWACGNTLNSPASDARPASGGKCTYFLPVRLAMCLQEGLPTWSTCFCMCSLRVSPEKTGAINKDWNSGRMFLYRRWQVLELGK